MSPATWAACGTLAIVCATAASKAGSPARASLVLWSTITIADCGVPSVSSSNLRARDASRSSSVKPPERNSPTTCGASGTETSSPTAHNAITSQRRRAQNRPRRKNTDMCAEFTRYLRLRSSLWFKGRQFVGQSSSAAGSSRPTAATSAAATLAGMASSHGKRPLDLPSGSISSTVASMAATPAMVVMTEQ